MRRSGFSGMRVAPWLAVMLAMACGGGDGPEDGPSDGGDGATVDASSDGAPGEGGPDDGGVLDASGPGASPWLTAVQTAGNVPIGSGTETPLSLAGGDLTADCVAHLDVGSRSTALTTTSASETMIAVTLPAAATEGHRGYATVRLTDCPGTTPPFPVHIATPPDTAWTGPSIAGLSPPTASVGTSIDVDGTYTISLAIERTPLASIPISGNAFTVPADFVATPLRFVQSASTQVFVSPPVYLRANIAAAATITASSTFPGYPTSNVVDGLVSSSWFPATGNCTAATCPQRDVWMQLLWPDARAITTIAFRDDASEGALYKLHRIRLEAYAAPPAGDTVPTFMRELSMPIGSNHADFAFSPPLTNVRALRIVVLRDDSEIRGDTFTGSIGELVVLAP